MSKNELAAKENVSLSYYFHGGETNRPFGSYLSSTETFDKSKFLYNENLYDIFLLKAKRVGHGISLVKNPVLMEKYKQAGITIEACPISNQVLGYVSDFRNHPALTYLNAGLDVTISPDDPSIFGYSGVTPDFWEVCVAWRLDLRALKQLAINSIKCSALKGEEKGTLLKVWQKKWDEFVKNQLLSKTKKTK